LRRSASSCRPSVSSPAPVAPSKTRAGSSQPRSAPFQMAPCPALMRPGPSRALSQRQADCMLRANLGSHAILQRCPTIACAPKTIPPKAQAPTWMLDVESWMLDVARRPPGRDGRART
jgi:hypothetical protein